MCCFWRELQQFSNRPAGLLTSPQLQHLPQQHQRDDHCRGFKVERRSAVFQKGSGDQGRQEHYEQAEEERRQRADCDQREHVQAQRAK